jgi:arabinofuranosyltransferase
LILGLAFTFRPDSILLFVLLSARLGMSVLRSKEDRSRATGMLRFGAAFSVVAVPWLVFRQFYFGQFLPETLVAKRAQCDLGYWPIYTVPVVLRQAFRSFGWPLTAAISLLTIWGASLSLHANRSRHDARVTTALEVVLQLLLFGVGEGVFYALARVTVWDWYVTPLV